MMKKFLIFMLFVLFFGCSNEPEEPKSEYGGSIIGTWKSITKDFVECYTFNNDGTGEYVFASYYVGEGYQFSTRPMTWKITDFDYKFLPYGTEKGFYLWLYNVDLKGEFQTQYNICRDTLTFIYHYRLESIEKPSSWYQYLDRNQSGGEPPVSYPSQTLYSTSVIAYKTGLTEAEVLYMIEVLGIQPKGQIRCPYNGSFCDGYDNGDMMAIWGNSWYYLLQRRS